MVKNGIHGCGNPGRDITLTLKLHHPKASRVKIAGYPASRTLSLPADRAVQVPPFPAIDPRRGLARRHLDCLVEPSLAGLTHCIRSWLQGPQCSTVVSQLVSPSCPGQLPSHLASRAQNSCRIYQLLWGERETVRVSKGNILKPSILTRVCLPNHYRLQLQTLHLLVQAT